jgi:threonine dehydrogenase-like Zn-dependent dehydrogenase
MKQCSERCSPETVRCNLRILGYQHLAYGGACGADCALEDPPEDLVTNRFPLEKADEAYSLMASGRSGKVAIVFDEELKVSNASRFAS